MNPVTQYLGLYRELEGAFRSGAPEPMNSLRGKALDALSDARLPRRGDEGYEKTSLEDIFASDYGINVNRLSATADIAESFRCDVPNLSTLLGITVNDTVHISPKVAKKLPEGVVFSSLRDAWKIIPGVMSSHYGRLASLERPEVALNTLLAQDGVMVYLPEGVRLEKPLQLVNIFASSTPVMGVRRVLVVAEPGAKGQLLMCDHTQSGCPGALSSQVVEIFCGAGAEFDYYDIEESSALTSRVSSVFVEQRAGSRLLMNGTTLTCGTTRNDYSVELAGEGSHTLLAGMAIGSAEMQIDNSSVVRHLAPRCHSNQLFKYVLDEKAQGAFEGSIVVRPEAPFTEAYQSNRNLLAGNAARMHTRPQLEIYNDDVKCSHGAATGQLDNEALFYMRTRGIPEGEARKMLMQAFMTDVIDTVAMEGLRDRLRHLVERRFDDNARGCSDCRATTSCKKQ